MKNKFLSFLVLFIAATVMFSCQDEFTEEDALNAQQSIDLAIYVYDGGSVNRAPVVGATVSFIQGGSTRTATTDEAGVALFPEAQIGGYIYSIEGSDFTTIVKSGSLYSNNFRQGQETFSAAVYLNSSTNTAIIKGRVAIELDLTNDVTEYASGIDLLAYVYLDNETKTFSVTTDAEGRYELSLPADFNQSTQVQIRFPDLELDQTLVYSKLSTESGSFPEVLPSVKTYPTLFTMYTGGAQNYNYFPSYDYQATYAIVEDAPAGQTTAVINQVYVNNDGEIIDISFSNYGNYSGDADGLVNVTFTSLTGGTGATLQIDLTNTSSLYTAYYINGDYTLNGGSGYSDDYLNRNYYESPTINSQYRLMSFYVYPGTTTIQNADYGTGIYRESGLE
jgi:hypothetical protein